MKSRQTGLIAEVKPVLDTLVNNAGFWVTEALYNRVLGLVNELDEDT